MNLIILIIHFFIYFNHIYYMPVLYSAFNLKNLLVKYELLQYPFPLLKVKEEDAAISYTLCVLILIAWWSRIILTFFVLSLKADCPSLPSPSFFQGHLSLVKVWWVCRHFVMCNEKDTSKVTMLYAMHFWAIELFLWCNDIEWNLFYTGNRVLSVTDWKCSLEKNIWRVRDTISSYERIEF